MVNELNKRGIFFALGIFLLATIVLTFAIIIYHNKFYSENRLSEFAMSDRLFDLFSSIEVGVKEVFHHYSDINISITKNSDSTTDVSFTEVLGKSKDEYVAEFKEKITLFKDYIEEKYPDNIELDISGLNMGKKKNNVFPLVILPHNISYIHDATTGQVYLKVIPSSLDNFNSYTFIVNTGLEYIDKTYSQGGIKWHKKSENSFPIQITAKDNTGYSITRNENIDLTKLNEFRIKVNSGPTIKIIIGEEPGQIYIWTPNLQPLITTKINLKPLGEEVYIYFKIILNINFPSFDISRRNLIKIL